MTSKEIVEQFKEVLQLGEDWNLRSGRGAAWLENQTQDGNINTISWSFLSFSKAISAGVTSGAVGIYPVEWLLRKYYKAYNLEYLNHTIYFSSKRNQDISVHSIEKTSDIEAILPILKNMVYEEVIPFFDRYQTVEQVYEQMESMERSEISSFIYHPPTPRMLIIKRLVNAPDFEEFGEWVVDIYKKMAEGPNGGQHAPFAQFLPDLFQELKDLNV
jgi:hypothetical protein